MKFNLASIIYLSQINTVKSILELLEFKEGKDSANFIYLKKQLFEYCYNNLKNLFIKLENEKIIKRCPKECSMRQGWTNCEYCNGCGYINFELEK